MISQSMKRYQILIVCISCFLSAGCSEDKTKDVIISLYSEVEMGESLEDVSALLNLKGVDYHQEHSSLDKKILSQLNYSAEELATIEEKLIVINEGVNTLTFHFSTTNELIKVMLIRNLKTRE